ncbi:MAG: hypothetical protein LBO72_03565 [Helicobacteraceae bacterium]|jgi:hypothetical protein|nr:hypothetical protein [Helicobacteraceae bacterium]
MSRLRDIAFYGKSEAYKPIASQNAVSMAEKRTERLFFVSSPTLSRRAVCKKEENNAASFI